MARMDVPLVALLGLVVCLGLSWVAARYGSHLGLLDAPAAHKVHTTPVPRSGGLALVAAVSLALLVAWACGAPQDGLFVYALPAAGFALLGLWDDRRRLPARVKLAAQVALAALAVALGLRWGGEGVGGFGALRFGDLTPWMSVLWIVAVVTVINFIDGIDLITAATTSVMLSFAAAQGAGPGGGSLFGAAAGAVLGFAFWNVTPARVIVGDCGTHLLGFLVAASALAPQDGSARALAWPWIGALLLPGVVDVGAGLVTKWRRGVALAAAHRDHPYQRLLRLGGSHPAVALRYGALAVLALVTVRYGEPWLGAAGAVSFGVLVLAAHLAQAARAPRAPASFFVGGPVDRGEH